MKHKNTLSNSRIKKLMKSAHTPSGTDKEHLRNDCASWFIHIEANRTRTVAGSSKKLDKKDAHSRARAEQGKIAAAYFRKQKAKKAAEAAQKEAETHEAQ